MARAAGVSFARETVPIDSFVTANGLRFHHLAWGEPRMPKVLMLHGFAQTCHSWDFAALSLCDRYHVLALDQRGHGDSEWSADGDYSPAAHQRDIAAIVQALGLSDFVLIGLSMGGRNALTYAAEHPERVRGLVLVDSAPEQRSTGAEAIRRFVAEKDELDSFEEFVARVKGYNPLRSEEQIRGSLRHNLKQLPNGSWTWKYDKVLRSPGHLPRPDPDMTARLWGYVKRVRCPTLVVRGAESDVVSKDATEEVCRRVRDCRLAVVERAGHLVPGDNPSRFNEVVSDFLTELDPVVEVD